MSGKSVLKIKKGEEFKIAIKNIEDGGTIFYDQYKQAFKMLDDIVNTSLKEKVKEKDEKYKKRWNSEDYENNIIAFCGERGEGKSSAMCTFINSLSDNNEKILEDIGMKESKIKDTYFDEPIIIDPSQFDDIHNILDIVLAKIYERFSSIYMDENNNSSEVQKEEVLNKFQKVYRQISMINNQTKILDNEFDYEGNIGKLSKLGESTKLKSTLKDLIDLYLKFAKENRQGINKGAQQIIIAIDDLDLCSANAYKMAEQIRKYLILPQVIIVMAVKIEQLELCVQENNLIDFEKVFKAYVGNHSETNPRMYNEIFGMAERYVSKLIPKARRIYLPKVQSLEKIDIEYEDGEENKKIIWSSVDDEQKSLVEKVLNLITEKTGMIFLPEESGISYLLPDNLRDMVNWIVRLISMETPNDDSGYLRNIQKFYQLFEIGTLNTELFDGVGSRVKAIWEMDIVHTHANAMKLLDEIKEDGVNLRKITPCGEREVELFQVMKKFEYVKRKVFDYEKEKKIYFIRSLYTIKMNQLKAEKKLFEREGFVNGYILGDKFQEIIPRIKLENNDYLERGRFEIKTIDLYNEIIEKIEFKVNKLENINDGIVRLSNIPKDKYRKDTILIWTLVGLFCNVVSVEMENSKTGKKFYKNNESIIYNNSNLMKVVEVSIENYIIGLCNIDEIYVKVNMEKLGITRDEFNEVVGPIKDDNKEMIKCVEKIVSNVDIGVDIFEYCKEHKESTSTQEERNKEIINIFFKNIYSYFKKRNLEIEVDKEKIMTLKIEKDKSINIGEFYAGIIECGIEYKKEQEEDLIKENYDELMNIFDNIMLGIDSRYSGEKEYKFSSYLKNTTVQNVKKNLEKMEGNIVYMMTQKLQKDYKKEIEDLEEKIRKLYSKVAKIYTRNPNEKLKDELIRNYCNLAAETKRFLNIIKNDN